MPSDSYPEDTLAEIAVADTRIHSFTEQTGQGGLSPAKKRRGAVACRRCRRLRSKCINHQAKPPCEGCIAAGAGAVTLCVFPRRGQKDVDRQFRRRIRQTREHDQDEPDSERPLVSTGSCQSTSPTAVSSRGGAISAHGHSETRENCLRSTPLSTKKARQRRTACAFSNGPRASSLTANLSQEYDALPPNQDVVEGCKTFVTSYFQLGFIPKAIFLENLTRDPSSTSSFLLSCILSISSRFTLVLIQRYGSPTAATDHFLALSRTMAATEMYHPSLERTQAFFLLAIAEWGNGDRDRSSMNMGVAVRMAALLKLHREETYKFPADVLADQVVRAESARRTFWMIQSQENLHSGYTTPAPFSLDDITVTLPCEESDFAFGIAPFERAALAGTRPAIISPSLTNSPQRCLFATLIQAHNLWGQVARHAGRPDPASMREWEVDISTYHRLTTSLRTWEEEMPLRHKWSVWNLRGWRAESLHLAYLSVVMVLRLSNIVIRRIYLNHLISDLTTHLDVPSSRHSYKNVPEGFWKEVSFELFSNVLELHEQVDAYFNMRTRDEGFPAILVFCVYMCGSLASYLWRHPQLWPHIASSEAEEMAMGALRVLGELHQAWPMSARWQQGLQHIASPLSAATSPAERRVGFIAGGLKPVNPAEVTGDLATRHLDERPKLVTIRVSEAPPMTLGDDNSPSNPVSAEEEELDLGRDEQRQAIPSCQQMEAFPNELFDAELAAFLEGGLQYGLLDDWMIGPN
jgi:hypothetical protein